MRMEFGGSGEKVKKEKFNNGEQGEHAFQLARGIERNQKT